MTCEEMMVAIGDSLSDLVSSNEFEVVEDEDNEQTEQGKLSEDDEPDWVIGTITKTVRQRMEKFQQKHMKLDELTQPGWEDASDYYHERDKKYGRYQFRSLEVVQPQTNHDPMAPALMTFGELVECLVIVPRISRMPLGTSRQGSCHIMLCWVKWQSNMRISDFEPTAEPDTSPGLNAMLDEPGSIYACR
jgi:hypothetical protein